jgi:hypothetical protein
MDEIRKLRSYCRRWGGDLVKITPAQYERISAPTKKFKRFYESQFSAHDLGIEWLTRRLYYSHRVGPPDWVEVIHEMGHLFATPDNPNESDEYTFFGWEYQLAARVGDVETWVAGNREYQVPRNREFGGLTPRARAAVIRRQIKVGQRLGILDAEGNPQAVMRKFDFDALQKTLDERVTLLVQRVNLNRVNGVRPSGSGFEQFFTSVGHAEGYEEATRDVINALGCMITLPAKEP